MNWDQEFGSSCGSNNSIHKQKSDTSSVKSLWLFSHNQHMLRTCTQLQIHALGFTDVLFMNMCWFPGKCYAVGDSLNGIKWRQYNNKCNSGFLGCNSFHSTTCLHRPDNCDMYTFFNQISGPVASRSSAKSHLWNWIM